MQTYQGAMHKGSVFWTWKMDRVFIFPLVWIGVATRTSRKLPPSILFGHSLEGPVPKPTETPGFPTLPPVGHTRALHRTTFSRPSPHLHNGAFFTRAPGEVIT